MSLGDYLGVFRRRWVLVTAIVLFCGGFAAAASLLQDERFESTATIIVRTPSTQSLFVAVPGNGALGRDITSELSLAESAEYQPAVSAEVRLRAASPADTSSLALSAQAPTPDVSEAVALEWAELYINRRRQFDLASVTASIESAEQSLLEVEQLEDQLLEPLQPIEDAIAVASDPDVISRLTTQRLSLLQSLDADLSPLRAQRQSLSSELGRQRITLRFLEDTPELGARLVSVSPGADLRSPLARDVVLGTAVGLILATALALLAENLRRRIRSIADLRSAVPGVIVLGELPETDQRNLAGPLRWRDLSADAAYRAGLDRLVTSLQLIAQEQNLASVLITSADAATGKSSVAASLALTLANEGQPVVLIDGDLRRPRVHDLFDIPVRPGLSDVLLGVGGLSDSFHLLQTEGQSMLGIVPRGIEVDSPAELFRSEALGKLVQELTDQPSMVVVDSPPLLPVTDASLITSAVDLAIVVCRAGETAPEDLANAVETLQRTSVAVGVLLVGSSTKVAYY